MLSSFRSIPFSLSRVAGSASVSTSRLAHVRNGTASRSLATLSSSSPSASDASDSTTRMAMAAASGVVMAALGVSLLASDQAQLPSLLPNRTQMEASSALEDDNDTTTTILNWSGTHNVLVDNHNYWEPETIEEVERIVQRCHERGQPVRPVGSALSPNGLAFRSGGMMSMANLDRIISVDKPSGSNSNSSGDEMPTVTVQAGARVSQVVDALREHGLTLPNLASIAEQQMGGFVQVGAHGTGKAIAPVDHYVTQLKLVTPARGTLTLRADAQDEDERELFHLAKVGLGCLGVVVEVTMQCIPAHMLVEHTFVLTRQEAKDQLDTLLKKHKHMRYMWIPFEDAVVCVTNDPEDQVTKKVNATNSMDEAERFQPLTDLLLELSKERQQHEEDFPPSLVTSSSVVTKYTTESIVGMGFGELRDALLAFDPLNVDHVKRVNKAEAEFWRKSEGYQTKPSDQLLQFDCGGQQWVWEVCFPTGTQDRDDGSDIAFMEELLAAIENENIPAPAPIEQRWSASSSSLMSPAYGDPKGLHSWVGIIHYLPSEDEYQRRDITQSFTGKYCNLMRGIGEQYSATSHWAKLEIPHSIFQIADLRLFMQQRFPAQLFNATRLRLDPKSILSNRIVDMAFGKSNSKADDQ